MDDISLFSYLRSKAFRKNVLIAIIITLAFFLGVFIVLRIYTDHGEAFSVPDFTAMTEEELKPEIEERNLRYTIIDSVYLQSIPKGTVADQHPKPGFQVKQDRMIYITMNATGREKLVMPNLKGVSLRQAKAIIENRGLQLGEINYVPDIAINNVLEQKYEGRNITEGDTIHKGASIDLILGGGLSDTRTYVPEVIGLRYNPAYDKITDAYLNMGGVNYDNSIETQEDSAKAFVWRQNPKPNENMRIRLGSLVDVWLTVDSVKLPGYDTLQQTDYEDEIW
ncbi:MAG: PASTA domain-containing protein [Bacteroidetes bacterium]|jgi:beta-lactam-binding protein with PASTA domain|nr:PASTA domain-containing protein [Bacteroidota bacterium]